MTFEEGSLLLSDWLKQRPAEVGAQNAALEHYGKFFHPSNLGNITQDDFRAFLFEILIQDRFLLHYQI